MLGRLSFTFFNVNFGIKAFSLLPIPHWGIFLFIGCGIILFPADINRFSDFQRIYDIFTPKFISGFLVAVLLIHRTKQAVYNKSVNVFLNFRQAVKACGACFGDYGVMIVSFHCFVVNNTAVKIKPCADEQMCSLCIFGTFSEYAYCVDDFITHILGNIIAVGSRIGGVFLFVKILSRFKSLLCGIAVYLVGFLLECCQTVEQGTVGFLFFRYNRLNICGFSSAFIKCGFGFFTAVKNSFG